MRVAFVTVGETSRLTGGYLYHARVLEGLRKAGLTIEEIVASGASAVEQEEAAPGFGAFDPRCFDVVVVDALARIVCASHIDRWRSARPLVAMVHELPSVVAADTDVREREYEKPLLRADLLIAVSAHGKAVLESRGVPAERIRIVPPGFDRLRLNPVQRSAPRDDAHVRVLCVAQWIPRKGILDLVRAWSTGVRSGATLELVGETDADLAYTASVRAAIKAVPDASIALHGSVDDSTLGDAYAAADLFALPSRYEGYGVVYAEALAYGLPILACEVGPVPELVGGEAALLVPPGDVGEISDALDLLLSNHSLRERMSAAAHRRVGSLPRWRDTIANFRRVLQESLKLARNRPA